MAYIAAIDGEEYRIDITEVSGKNLFILTVGEKKYNIDVVHSEHSLYSMLLDGKSYEIDLDAKDGICNILVNGEHYSVNVINEKKKALWKKSRETETEGKQSIITEMPGKVVKIFAEVGKQVKQGQGMIVVEAMKMENELKSPKDGKVIEINVKEGETVEGGTTLVVIE